MKIDIYLIIDDYKNNFNFDKNIMQTSVNYFMMNSIYCEIVSILLQD